MKEECQMNNNEFFETATKSENVDQNLLNLKSYACFATHRSFNMIFVIKMTLMAAIGGFLFGYDTGVIGGANLYFHLDFPHITSEQKEMIVSLTVIGAAVGSLLIGPIADNYGRKITIIIADFLFILGAFLVTCYSFFHKKIIF